MKLQNLLKKTSNILASAWITILFIVALIGICGAIYNLLFNLLP